MLQRSMVVFLKLDRLHTLYLKLLLLEEEGSDQQLPIEQLGLCFFLEFKESVGMLR